MNRKALGIFIIIVVFTGGYWAYKNQTKNRPSEVGANLESKTSQEIPSETAIFYTNIFVKRDVTKVLIPFSFKDKIPRSLWLYLSMKEGQNYGMLAYDPRIQGLNWNFVKGDSVNLFEKSKTYASIEMLIKSPPPKEKVVIDEEAAKDPRFSNLDFEVLDENTDFTNKEFILTTYKPVRESNGWLWQETTVDATKALINESNQMVWTVQAPSTTTENPYYLGEINLVYE